MILISISSVSPYINILSNTVFWWIVQLAIIYLIISCNKHYIKLNLKNYFFIVFLIILSLTNFIRGCFLADNYWDWKNMINNLMIMLIPLITFTTSSIKFFPILTYHYLKYALPFFFIIVFFIPIDAYGFYLMPVTFFLLFFPILPKKWKIITVLFALTVFFADLTARSNVIKFLLPIFFSFIYYLRNIINKNTFNIIRISLFSIPIILFCLAIAGIFNPFEIDKYAKFDVKKIEVDSEGNIREAKITDDTRTFIYKEVLETAKRYNTWIFGRSLARGNETQIFKDADLTGRGERYGNEVLIPNIFTWLGLIGVLIYFLIYYKASYLAIKQSNNIFSVILGIFIAFRWFYGWVEDSSRFSLNTFFLWITIGLCYSKEFRGLNNHEVKLWLTSIFNFERTKKYYKRTIIEIIKTKYVIKDNSSSTNLP